MGCPLFARHSRGTNLTSEGERLFKRVSIAIENIEAGAAEIIERRNLESGSVYVAASEVALHCVLLPVLQEYHRQHPGVRLKISNHSTPQAIEAIKNGIADIALVTTRPFRRPALRKPPCADSTRWRSAAVRFRSCWAAASALRSCCAIPSYRSARRRNPLSCIRNFLHMKGFPISRKRRPRRLDG